jgi:glycosyltransferase involved in cell wall biosynthesis
MIHAARAALGRLTEAERARVVFVVIGDTPADFRADHVDECRELAGRLGLGARFHMLGFRPDVRPLVADFDVAVVPSVYADPLPRAVIESMALGKPVVAFGVGGVVEIVDDGVTGELVAFEPGRSAPSASAGAVERLAQAFVRYARDAPLRATQGRSARAHAVARFDARPHGARIQGEIVAAAGMGPGEIPV